MDTKLEEAQRLLDTYKQEHLLDFYDDLSAFQKDSLLNQILSIDFEEILSLYENSRKPENFDISCVSPLEHIEKEKLSTDEIGSLAKIGEEIIRSGSFAVVTMAGGQGTRLGYKGPKGTYELDLKPMKKSLFQIMCENIKQTNRKYNIIIPWYIMTSEENDSATKTYFEEHDYFGYPKEKITFFTQGKLPIITVDGKLILQETYLVKEASNGNGNVFLSMKKHGIIEDLEKNNITWLSFGGIDNVLLKNADPLFLGLTISQNCQVASKTIFKEQPLEKTAVYCKKFGKPAILDYDVIDLSLSNLKFEDGTYCFREANMLSHLVSFDALKKLSSVNLRYHRAYKKNTFINSEGMKQVPDKPNSFKFENFIFDGFSYFDNMTLLRVNPDEEFAPIKDFTGIYNPDTAKEKYLKYYEMQWCWVNIQHLFS